MGHNTVTKTDATAFIKPFKDALHARDRRIHQLEAENAQLKGQLGAIQADCKRMDQAITFLSHGVESHKRHLQNIERKLKNGAGKS